MENYEVNNEDKIYTDQEGNKFVVISTKIEVDQYKLFCDIAERMRQSKYMLIQQAISAFISLMSFSRRITDELQKLCLLFGMGIHFEKRFNLVNPSVEPEVQGAIFFMGNRSMKGTQPVYVDKPFMGEAEQSENVPEMFDRFLDAANHELYCKMCRERDRRSVASNWYLLVTWMQENEGIEDIEEIETMFADNRRSEYGKTMADGPYRRTMVNSKTADDYLARMDRFESRQTELDLDIEN